MLLKINSNGTVLYSIPESINQGSNLANSIQIIAPFSKTLTADIAFQLPQGTITEPVIMVPREFSSNDSYNLWTVDIDSPITQYAGNVLFSVRFYTLVDTDEDIEVLTTVRSSFPVSKSVLPALPLEPTAETYQNVLAHISDLYLSKVDRFDINDLPDSVEYTAEGFKTSNALFTNATFTVSETVYNGSLMVLVNETVDGEITTRVQTEILYADDTIFRRMITIVDEVVTVGDWKNYSTEITDLQNSVNDIETELTNKVDKISTSTFGFTGEIKNENGITDIKQYVTNTPNDGYSKLIFDGQNNKAGISQHYDIPLLGIDFNNEINLNQNGVEVTTDKSFTLNTKRILTEADKGIANGVASLDSTGKVPTEQLPPISITEVFVVNGEAEMLALTAQIGDIAIRTDLTKSFILKESPASILANWQELLSPSAGAVVSVNGETGIVTLDKANIGLGNVDNTSDLNKPVSTATQNELNKKVNVSSSINQIYATLDNNNGTLRLITQDNTNIPTQQFVNNIQLANGDYIEIRNWENGQSGIVKDNTVILTTDTFTHNGNEILDTSTGLTKASQTLTSEEQSQVRTNIDVYSKLEVDNKVSSVFKYKGSVATYEDLPTEDLSIGDVWNVIDTGDNYAWTGTIWDKLGGDVDLSNYLAKDNTTAFTPTGDYNPATKKYADNVANDKIDNDQKGVANGVATLDANIKIPLAQLPSYPTKTIYVDKNRTDAYTEDGTILTPYKTITSAIAYVISLNYDGYINIEINNGIYAETITLENEALKYIVLTGKGYVAINPASGNALQSTANNTNLFALHINNIIFSKPVVLTGVNGTTAFTDVMFNNVKFNETGTITASCINNLSFTNGCYDECDIALNNVNYVYQQGSQLQGNLSITSDSTENVPSQGLGSTLMVDSITLLGSPTYTIVGTGTITLAVTGSRWGVNSAVSVPAGVTIYAYNTFLRGTHTNNGAIVLRSGSTIESYVAGTGTLTITGNDSKFQYYNNSVSGLTATNVNSAIDEVKSKIVLFAGFTVAVEDFVSNLTYSMYPYRASVAVTGISNTDNPKVYFSASDINTANENQTNYMIVAYTNGIHIYASALPDSALTVENIEVIR